MTEEELKKKLEKKAEKECVLNDRIHIDCFVSGYLKGALPREKRIVELEKEIEKHKWNDILLEDCADYDKKIAEEYKTLQERIQELEKEIAELKKTETMLKILKDRGVIKSWYYNGNYHIGNELP